MNTKEMRIKEHLGIVTSDTGTAQFSFFVTPLRNKLSIVEGSYVLVDHPAYGELCPLVAKVKEIKNYEEVVGTTFTEKTVECIAVSDVIGYVDLRNPEVRVLRKLLTPPNPGSKVYLPYVEFLEDAFLRDAQGRLFEHALHLGMAETFANARNGEARMLKFYLDAGALRKQHLLITGMAGAGKTHTAAVIGEEIANKTGYPLVVLDPWGEYTTLGVVGTRVTEQQHSTENYPFNFKVAIHACDPQRVKAKLKQSKVALGQKANYSVTRVKGKWAETPSKQAVLDMGEMLNESVKPKQVTIIDSRGLSQDERQNFFSCCVRGLWNCRVDGSVGPFLLIVEEAEAIDVEVMKRIASEGRKFGVSLCLLTQHPCEVSANVLSQTGTQILGRTTNTGDLERLKNMALEKAVDLPKLAKGEWIVNGITMRRPLKVLMRERYSTQT